MHRALSPRQQQLRYGLPDKVSRADLPVESQHFQQRFLGGNAEPRDERGAGIAASRSREFAGALHGGSPCPLAGRVGARSARRRLECRFSVPRAVSSLARKHGLRRVRPAHCRFEASLAGLVRLDDHRGGRVRWPRCSGCWCASRPRALRVDPMPPRLPRSPARRPPPPAAPGANRQSPVAGPRARRSTVSRATPCAAAMAKQGRAEQRWPAPPRPRAGRRVPLRNAAAAPAQENREHFHRAQLPECPAEKYAGTDRLRIRRGRIQLGLKDLGELTPEERICLHRVVTVVPQHFGQHQRTLPANAVSVPKFSQNSAGVAPPLRQPADTQPAEHDQRGDQQRNEKQRYEKTA